VEGEHTQKVPDYWHFTDSQLEVVERVYGKDNYKVPCYARAGSMIFWYSTTPHQAQRQVDAPFWNKMQPSGGIFEKMENLQNWRCVFYQTQLPRKFYNTTNLNGLWNAYLEGKTTNHLGKHFGRFDKYEKAETKDKRVAYVTCNPAIYQTQITLKMKKLIKI
jgi:hypothetical protein